MLFVLSLVYAWKLFLLTWARDALRTLWWTLGWCYTVVSKIDVVVCLLRWLLSFALLNLSYSSIEWVLCISVQVLMDFSFGWIDCEILNSFFLFFLDFVCALPPAWILHHGGFPLDLFTSWLLSMTFKWILSDTFAPSWRSSSSTRISRIRPLFEFLHHCGLSSLSGVCVSLHELSFLTELFISIQKGFHGLTWLVFVKLLLVPSVHIYETSFLWARGACWLVGIYASLWLWWFYLGCGLLFFNHSDMFHSLLFNRWTSWDPGRW